MNRKLIFAKKICLVLFLGINLLLFYSDILKNIDIHKPRK